ncbi:MAG TPA: heterodisulfide reductase-related iron-sulfur binding cluster [Blastocatellia bacterium]|nr:heterodisulfide reductase-related iron-sulfur binding cluster [Blastocatellia bacterium]
MVAEQKIEHQTGLASLLAENSDRLLTCVHCGLCLQACPTYRELGNENDSPRGRIYLMRGLAEGKLGRSDAFIEHIDLCLGCRACETVCPSGVPYGHLLEAARVEVVEAKAERGSAMGFVVGFVLNHIFTRPKLLRAAMAFARWFRDSGMAQLALDTQVVSGRLRFALALLLSSRSPLAGTRKMQPPKNAGEADKADAANVGMKVAVLRGCVMEGLFSEANRATERVLERNGCQLADASDQMCCGALHAHAGHIETARELARKNIDAFLNSGCERVIVNSAGCGAAMKEYRDLLAGDAEYRERARDFSAKVRDISEFLMEIGLRPPTGKVARRVAYDAPCHLMHAQRVVSAPVDVLKTIPGVTLAPLQGYESCCGGAGIYNLQHVELSNEILLGKMENIRASGADTVATANPGCIMQIGAGALLNGLKVDVIHPIELLDRAYEEK